MEGKRSLSPTNDDLDTDEPDRKKKLSEAPAEDSFSFGPLNNYGRLPSLFAADNRSGSSRYTLGGQSPGEGKDRFGCPSTFGSVPRPIMSDNSSITAADLISSLFRDKTGESGLTYRPSFSCPDDRRGSIIDDPPKSSDTCSDDEIMPSCRGSDSQHLLQDQTHPVDETSDGESSGADDQPERVDGGTGQRVTMSDIVRQLLEESGEGTGQLVSLNETTGQLEASDELEEVDSDVEQSEEDAESTGQLEDLNDDNDHLGSDEEDSEDEEEETHSSPSFLGRLWGRFFRN